MQKEKSLSEFRTLQRQLDDTLEKRNKTLSESEKQLLEQAIDTWGKLNLICGEIRFTEELRVGVKIMVEIFEKNDKQLGIMILVCRFNRIEGIGELSEFDR